MAIPFLHQQETFLVPLRIDTALDMTTEQYNEFLETGDIGLIKCKEGMTPTYFKLRRTLPYKLSMRLENLKTELVVKRENGKTTSEPNVRMAFMLEEIRFSIVDIVNPPNAPTDEIVTFTKDAEGLCSPEVMQLVLATGCHMDLWTAKQTSAPIDKKK